MKSTSILVASVVAAAAFAFAISVNLPGSAVPPNDVLPLFVLIFLAEAVALGAGVAYVLRARRTLFGGADSPLQAAVAWSVAYLLITPWPHDLLHRMTHTNGVYNWPALAAIEFVFHLGIVPIGVAVAAHLFRSRDALVNSQ